MTTKNTQFGTHELGVGRSIFQGPDSCQGKVDSKRPITLFVVCFFWGGGSVWRRVKISCKKHKWMTLSDQSCITQLSQDMVAPTNHAH